MSDMVPYWWLFISFALGAFCVWMGMRETAPVLSHREHKEAVDRIIVQARSESLKPVKGELRQAHNAMGLFYDRVQELMDELHRYEEEGALLVSLSKEMLEIIMQVTDRDTEDF